LLVRTALAAPAPPAAPADPATAGHIDVLFSPGGGCQERVVAELGKAVKTIRMQAYTFTSSVVAAALRDAKERGVECEVILDSSNRTDKFSAARIVREAGIPCLIDDSHTVANNKVIIIDDATLLTGSYNFTRAAEAANAENLLVITGMPQLLKAYADNYRTHREHGRPFDSARTATQPALAGEAISSPQPAPAADAKPALTGKVYVTPNGKKYHRAGCEFLRGAGRPIDRSEIKGKYTSCSKCRPG
jgi:phosphatidylserine/phosphatidylglycerophosphate/cardiolipin synthase-like enzyme